MSSDSCASIASSTRFRPIRPLPRRALVDETVVVDPQGRRVFSLNGVAGLVWSAVERGDSEGEIVAAVVRDYQVDEARARHDVDDFLRRLETLRLAVRQEPTL
jgi:hypothetical protein